MPQFSFLRTYAATQPENGELVGEFRYLDFRKFPYIRQSVDLAGSTLFNRVSDAENHAKVFAEDANKMGAGAWLQGRDEVYLIVEVVHYEGDSDLSMSAYSRVLETIHFKKG